MFYISYFYQIRFFPDTLVPVSTAVYDPKWYHDNKGNNYLFKDKRGVINGVRCPGLAPLEEHIPWVTEEDKCVGREICNFDRTTCGFLRNYEKYIYSLDFNDTCSRIEAGVHKLKPNADICLMVHEKFDNPCSEREVLVKWFRDNGVILNEWFPNKDSV